MIDLILYPLIESWATAYLKAQLSARGDSVEVSTKYPRAGSRHVRLATVGGSEQTDVTSNRTLIVQCYGTSEPDAARLAELCFAIIRAAPRDPDQKTARHVVTVGHPVYFPDPGGLPRYQFSVSIQIRGQVS